MKPGPGAILTALGLLLLEILTMLWCRCLKVGLLALLLWFNSAWAGDIYRWVDETGNVHYSEEPPPEQQQQQKLSIEPLPRSGTQFATDEQIKELHQGNKEAIKAQKQREQSKARADQQKKKYCDRKRKKLADIQAYLAHTDNSRDRRKEKGLIELLERECRGY